MAASYKIVLTTVATRNLKALPRAVARRVDAKLLGLRRIPARRTPRSCAIGTASYGCAWEITGFSTG